MVHAASMIRRDVLLRFPYNEKFAFGSDFDLNLRLVEAGHELNHTGTYLLMRRMHGQNVTTTDSSAQKNSARTSVRERRAAIPTVDREQMAMKAKREKPASIRDVAPEQLRAMFPKALSGDSHRRAPRSRKKEKRLKRSTLIAYSCGGVFVASLALLIGWNSEALFRGDIVMLGAISLLGLMLAVAGGVYLFRVIKQLRKQVKGLRSDVRHDQNRLEKIVRDNHDQALHQMRLIQSEAEIAKLGLMPMSVQSSWSAAADFLTILMRELADHRPQTIVELGPGTSTLVMAKCLQDLALDARIYAVEHDQRYATETSRLLEANGLEDCVEVVIAPIVDTPLGPYYDLEKLLPNLVSIDLLVIDGPPGETDAEARFPALPFFSPLLSNGGIMLLNDGHRGDERVIVARWKSEFPDLEVQFIDNSRGCFRFRKPVGNSAIVQTDLDTCDQGNP
jgi:predicted O-methyltransferase YrrM